MIDEKVEKIVQKYNNIIIKEFGIEVLEQFQSLKAKELKLTVLQFNSIKNIIIRYVEDIN